MKMDYIYIFAILHIRVYIGTVKNIRGCLSFSLRALLKNPALIIGAPYGAGVKEQGPCVYGNELAQKGLLC